MRKNIKTNLIPKKIYHTFAELHVGDKFALPDDYSITRTPRFIKISESSAENIKQIQDIDYYPDEFDADQVVVWCYQPSLHNCHITRLDLPETATPDFCRARIDAVSIAEQMIDNPSRIYIATCREQCYSIRKAIERIVNHAQPVSTATRPFVPGDLAMIYMPAHAPLHAAPLNRLLKTLDKYRPEHNLDDYGSLTMIIGMLYDLGPHRYISLTDATDKHIQRLRHALHRKLPDYRLDVIIRGDQTLVGIVAK